MAFVVGSIVRVRGVDSPKMVVSKVNSDRGDGNYSCLWFDADRVARDVAFSGVLLEAVTPEGQGSGPVPALGTGS